MQFPTARIAIASRAAAVWAGKRIAATVTTTDAADTTATTLVQLRLADIRPSSRGSKSASWLAIQATSMSELKSEMRLAMYTAPVELASGITIAEMANTMAANKSPSSACRR